MQIPYFNQNLCRERVSRPESRSDFSVYENADPKTKIITKRPYFQQVYPMKIGTFVYCEILCGNLRNIKNSEFVRKRLAARDGQPVPYSNCGKTTIGEMADIESAPTILR